MKILDFILLCLVCVLLINASYSYAEMYFSNANDWIPSAFGDEVQWHPSATFYWGISSVICGLFLCRFAPRPIPTAFVVAAFMVVLNLYPSFQQLGLSTTLKQLFSSFQTARDYLQLLGLLPAITWLLHWLIKPNREHDAPDEE